MRFWYRNEPVMLPADWVWHVEPADDGERIRIERQSGKRMTLPEAITAAELETTSSKAANKIAIFPGPKR